jgi:hypothetical protein
MGIFDAFKSGHAGQFVKDSKHNDNTNMQVQLVPEVLNQLRNIGIDSDKKLKLEYFFYTDSLEKAAQFANHLQHMSYSVDFGKSASDKKSFIVTGWTTEMKTDRRNGAGMDETDVRTWIYFRL